MATDKQIEANQQNSKLSTGPKTEEGKAQSSANSIKYGFYAKNPVLREENRDEFNQLLEILKSNWNPETQHELTLVTQMAAATWKLSRLEGIEVTIIDSLDSPEKIYTDDDTAKRYERLQRDRKNLERAYYRAARELRAMGKVQKEAKSEEAAEKQTQSSRTPLVDMMEQMLEQCHNRQTRQIKDAIEQQPWHKPPGL